MLSKGLVEVFQTVPVISISLDTALFIRNMTLLCSSNSFRMIDTMDSRSLLLAARNSPNTILRSSLSNNYRNVNKRIRIRNQFRKERQTLANSVAVSMLNPFGMEYCCNSRGVGPPFLAIVYFLVLQLAYKGS